MKHCFLRAPLSCAIGGALVLLLLTVASRANELSGPSVSVMQENDLVVRTDRHYTQGLKFTYLHGEAEAGGTNWVSRWTTSLPKWGLQPTAARFGVSVGQNIYTPTDTAATVLQAKDRPYAGYLYGSFFLQRRDETAAQHSLLDHWQLELGIIGPDALGEEAQNTVHKIRNFPLVKGWANQLRDEPALALKYQRTWRYSVCDGNGWSLELLPHAGASLGSSMTFAAVGGQLRAGFRLPRDFGHETIDSILSQSGGRLLNGSPTRGGYFFAGAEGRVVGHNAFLDGNLFHSSHSVSSHPLVGDLKFGVVYSGKRFDLSLTQIVRSKEYVGQSEIDAFGSVSLTYKW
ncbi:MAG: lipid A deacylase LpxR family protein [Verrucomicrobia bacterium]|nr:lipid A deacylase LpxR family protein [Verrucomicrobiota bacterium]